jgi:predicted dehydrogenase
MGVGFLRYETGLTMLLRASWAANVPEGFARTIIVGSRAGLAFSPLTLIGSTGRYQSDTRLNVPASPDIPFYGHWLLAEHMVRLIAGEEEAIVKADEVINVLKALTALYRSADTGREVIIE